MLLSISIRGATIVALVLLSYAVPATAEELSLEQAIKQALAKNPTIAAGQLWAGAARESARGARALANPDLLVAPSVVGTAGSDSAVLLMQPLEINGSRTARSRIAAHEADAAAHSARATSRDIVLSVKQHYWDTARAQQVVQLNTDNVAYLEALDKAARKQLEVGNSPGSQVIKTEVELARARQELAQAQLELDNTRSALATLLNRPAGSDFTASDPLAFTALAMDKEKLTAAALKNRPEVLSTASQSAAAQGQVAAARAKLVPDIALQARKAAFDPEGFRGEGGVAIAVTLPFLDWGSVKAERRSAETDVAARQKELEAARNAVALDVEQAVRSVETAARIVSEYEGGILDKSARLADMARKGYESGATSYLEVLEAQRTLRSVRTAYYSALADHAKALARLEWAAGTEVK